MEEEKKGISKKVIYIIIGVSILFCVVLALAFYIFYSSPKEVKTEKAEAGSVSLTYADDFNGLTITNAIPTNDSVGMVENSVDKYFDFTVDTEVFDDVVVNYEISVEKDEISSTTMDSNIRVYLEEQSSGSYVKKFGPETFVPSKKKTKIGSPKGSMVLATVSKKKSSMDNYRLRLWLSDKAVVNPGDIQNFTFKVVVNGKAE